MRRLPALFRRHRRDTCRPLVDHAARQVLAGRHTFTITPAAHAVVRITPSGRPVVLGYTPDYDAARDAVVHLTLLAPHLFDVLPLVEVGTQPAVDYARACRATRVPA